MFTFEFGAHDLFHRRFSFFCFFLFFLLFAYIGTLTEGGRRGEEQRASAGGGRRPSGGEKERRGARRRRELRETTLREDRRNDASITSGKGKTRGGLLTRPKHTGGGEGEYEWPHTSLCICCTLPSAFFFIKFILSDSFSSFFFVFASSRVIIARCLLLAPVLLSPAAQK